MADTGMAYTLIEGTGKIYGLVIIENMEETKRTSLKMALPVKPNLL